MCFFFFPSLTFEDKNAIKKQRVMKKIIYLAPLALLGLGVKASANQTSAKASTHISNALMVLEKMQNKDAVQTEKGDVANSQPVGKSGAKQNNEAEKTFPNGETNEQNGQGQLTDESGTKLINHQVSLSLSNGQDKSVGKIEQTNYQANSTLPNSQNQLVGQTKQAAHISRLDMGIVSNAKADSFTANTQTISINKLFTISTNQLQNSKISSTETHRINDPAGNIVYVHYVDEQGHTIQELPESSIKLSDFSVGQSQGKFDVPDHRYVLADPNAQYTVDHTQKTIKHPAITHKEHHDGYDLWACYITDEDKERGIGVSRYVPIGTAAGDVLGTSFNDAEFIRTVQPYDETIVDKEAYTTKEDNYSFLDNSRNAFSVVGGNTVNVILKHNTKPIDPSHSGLSNDATNNAFVINNGAKRQINSQSRHFGAVGVLDLVTKKITKQDDWQLLGESNFDQTNINNDLVGYGNAIHSNLTFLAL